MMFVLKFNKRKERGSFETTCRRAAHILVSDAREIALGSDHNGREMYPKTRYDWSYRSLGIEAGPCAVFLHGFMGSSADWIPVARLIENRFRLVLVDIPGHGAAPLPSGHAPIDMEGVVDDLGRLFDRLKIRESTLVGYSMGGRVAIHFSVRYPHYCSRLVLASTSPGLESETERRSRRKADEILASELEEGEMERFLEKWYKQSIFISLGRRPDLLRTLLRERSRHDPRSLAAVLRGLGPGSHTSLWSDLPSLRMPTVAIAGELDTKYVELARRMAALAPDITARIIPDAGHIVHLEDPVSFVRAMREG